MNEVNNLLDSQTDFASQENSCHVSLAMTINNNKHTPSLRACVTGVVIPSFRTSQIDFASQENSCHTSLAMTINNNKHTPSLRAYVIGVVT